MSQHYHLIGVGIGPFHLSLAALLDKVKDHEVKFFDQKPHFQWHPELLFNDADMQTSYLKDLVTAVDPTSPHSFLNYLVQNGLFYTFMNTNRKVITRCEFELYCQWVSKNIRGPLAFNSSVQDIEFVDNKFVVTTNGETHTSTHLSIATGLTPRIPEFSKPFLGTSVFHAKSPLLMSQDFTNKKVLIIGGGQTGVEIFRNGIQGKWGKPAEIKLFSRRQNLEPLDESPFTNEYFNPKYVEQFFAIDHKEKAGIVQSQKLASDGNTPQYLELLYNDLYRLNHIEKNTQLAKILPKRTLIGIEKNAAGGYKAIFDNSFLYEKESFDADIIILSTGFVSTLPPVLNKIKHLLELDTEQRFKLDRSFRVKWKGPAENKIYALNFSRHLHGIAEPQTSLMAWRSATIINDLMDKEIYKPQEVVPTFIQYGRE
ncbi:lysine N(6)-hydroxylase/L-ornithine N(5)-oxygenase family protein [Peredibacter starrii]|uniref:SidA/IucD/PvdA family monooxygenase n=1 Tax=Peredibacter starrii TaxID=28202 RepID=A0AAX4HME6_9BACT|nr:SidA/IucD/PvdA family monooxygenase [Peredibacter starrii]WPU64104.1 SidA/IucD/PvdA family monooxygenase [Peredibacter starrii]